MMERNLLLLFIKFLILTHLLIISEDRQTQIISY